MACRHRAANEKFNLLFVLSSWSAVLLSQFYSGNGGGAGCWRLHLQCQSALLRSNKWMFPPNRVQQVSALCIRPVCYCEFGWSLASLFFFFFFYLPAFKIINSDILRQTFPPSLHTHTHTQVRWWCWTHRQECPHCLLLSRMALQSSDQDRSRLWDGLVGWCLLWQAVNRMCSHVGLGSTPDQEVWRQKTLRKRQPHVSLLYTTQTNSSHTANSCLKSG